MEKLSFEDFTRICLKRTDMPCKVKKGNVIEIYENAQKIVGLVIETYESKMRILVGTSGYEWWSRYVNCKIIC